MAIDTTKKYQVVTVVIPSKITPIESALLGNATEFAVANTLVKRDSNGVAYSNNQHVLLRSTVLTTCAHGVYTPIVWDTVRQSVGTFWSGAANTKLYAPVSGLYLIVANIAFVTNATGQRGIAIRQAGSIYRAAGAANAVTGSYHNVMPITQVLQLSAGDYVEIMGYQTSGANLDAAVQSNSTPEAQMVLL